MQLDVERARRVLEKTIAKPLGTSVDEACAAIIEVANASMLKMLRIVTVEKGLDPADFTLVAFGGNGPVFGIELADDLGMREVIIPPAPGLLSAQGLLAADLRYDFRQTFVGAVASADLAEIEARFTALEAQGRNALQSHGIGDAAIVVTRPPICVIGGKPMNSTCRCRPERCRRRLFRRWSRASIKPMSAFMAAAMPRARSRSSISASHSLAMSAVPNIARSRPATAVRTMLAKVARNVFFANRGSFDCVCYERPQLRAGDSLKGPAIVEAADSTTLLPPDWSLRCDRIGNLFATRNG